MREKAYIHNRRALARDGVLAFLATVLCQQSAAAEESELWSRKEASGDTSSIYLNFVRGNVEITRRPGPVVVEVQKRSASGRQSVVSIVAVKTNGELKIIDQYPVRPWTNRTECLPTTGKRGYFWDNDTIMETRIWAPSETKISTHFMSREN